MNGQPMNGRRLLGPPRSRAPWVAWGSLMQVLGAGSVAAVVWGEMRSQGIGGHITAEMIELAWRSELHTSVGLTVLVAGSVVYAAGSVVMARPYISSPVMLFVAVPAAAAAGLLIIGVLALVVTAVVALFMNQGDFIFDFGRPAERRRKRR